MPSSQNNSTFVISNITNLVSVKLDRENYLLWRHQFSALLRSHDLYGFVDGTHPCPEKHLTDSTGVVSTKINPEYVKWHRQDQSLICWINSTLTESVLSHIVVLGTSQTIWHALEKRYASLTRSHISQLKLKLQTLKKGGSSMTDYLEI